MKKITIKQLDKIDGERGPYYRVTTSGDKTFNVSQKPWNQNWTVGGTYEVKWWKPKDSEKWFCVDPHKYDKGQVGKVEFNQGNNGANASSIAAMSSVLEAHFEETTTRLERIETKVTAIMVKLDLGTPL